MKTIKRLVKIIFLPKTISREIIQDEGITASLSVVLGFGVILSLMFAISHLKGDYPPPPDELEVWLDTWGEFAMLPFLKIPAERYRLVQAILMVPMILAVWILMAGSARILSILFGGKVSFQQYLNLFGFSFFAFWILGSLLDAIYSGIFGDEVLNALRMEYGTFAKTLATYFPQVMWVGVLSLGGIYNGIVIHEHESFSRIQTVLMGMTTFVWPIVLISTITR